MNGQNMSMLADFYEFTMSNGYLKNGFYKRNTYFDVFFRSVPDGGGFAIAAGLEQVIDYIKNLHFEAEEIEYFRSKNMFDEDFMRYLAEFKFTGDIYAVPEGTPVFPNEPIMTVKAPAIEAQLIETFVLLTLNHQSLIATKANRIVRAAQGRAVLEFGSRRAQGASGAIDGARAAYIGGAAGTACTLSDMLYGVPASGTMAHSWVQMFDTEYEAFEAYCKLYPNSSTLLVDTYNTLKSGVPNAIKAFKNILVPMGIKSFAIRLDSGDISYLSKKARKMLDEAGLEYCKIVASNSLDEHLISDLVMQGAKIDLFGVGERMITSKSSPVFGGVYKLVAVENDSGEIVPKIKISENVGKITNPHFKKLYRLYDRESGKAIADQLCVYDETIDDRRPIIIFDQNATWKTKTLTSYTAKELLQPIFKNGELVYNIPPLSDIKAYCENQVSLLWDEVKRFENPHSYYVDLSEKLWGIKRELLEKAKL
ncbi:MULTISPECIES: nicotinate phosphoribosyltransferase [unclassified Ruminococcus]|uniref:nicotinate phosphoribosyltransferase n=1 Tax=unclassified Ruminococcus TaxID=2608920 RepID=UPI00210C06AC|nr:MULTISPECIES: nicotinate phosphoribosyltransferase [unclassified Ruminococcus]MCQ4021860.1 nicotinate phosphoribosyltransferase [Ruminococcus sp. zg-924]MCQ4114305.1 nicotinate phosphoribosyltransferase [Ruminococcus sp. zg-921]